MPKSRKNRNFVGRKAERRLKNAAAFSQAAQVRIMVGMLPNQATYDAFLLQEPDPERRKKLYDFTKGFCKFKDPKFPTPIISGTILGPDGRPVA